MLLELAAANAAYAVIKESIANGGDLMAAGQHLFTFFDNKAALQKTVSKGGNKSDMEEFFALEQLKQKEAELKEFMIYSGRAGLWDDWLSFQVEARRKREKAEAEERLKKARFKQKIKDAVNITLAIILVSTGLFAVVGFAWVIVTKGNFA